MGPNIPNLCSSGSQIIPSNSCHQFQMFGAKVSDYFTALKVDFMIAVTEGRWSLSTGMKNHTAHPTEHMPSAHLSVKPWLHKKQCLLFLCLPWPYKFACLHFSGSLNPFLARCDYGNLPKPWGVQRPCSTEDLVPQLPQGCTIHNIEGHLMSVRKEWYQCWTP